MITAIDPREHARWCRTTRAAIAEMTDGQLIGTLASVARYAVTSPTYAAVRRMALHEARKARGWTAVAGEG